MFNTEGAACIGLDPELFFPTNNISPKIEDLLKKTCLRCPVFDNCLDYSLKVKVSGYWAGTTESKREELRRFFHITPVRIDQQVEREYRSSTKETGAR